MKVELSWVYPNESCGKYAEDYLPSQKITSPGMLCYYALLFHWFLKVTAFVSN